MDFTCFKLMLFYLLVRPTNLQLLINVKNQGGDVMQENITANVSEDTITLEFLRLDGIFITQLVDFTNEVEAMKMVIPGEEELGQSGHQTLCFLTHAAQADFIAPDAMAKLRQKNPGTVRVAEEDKGWRQSTMTAWAGRAARLLSSAAARHCRAAGAGVYLRAADLERWPPRPGMEESYSSAVTAFPERALAEGDGQLAACARAAADQDCICHLELDVLAVLLQPWSQAVWLAVRNRQRQAVCVNWYPCGLKYCKGKPQGGLSYRCGIKTCRRCYRYQYYVSRRGDCPPRS